MIKSGFALVAVVALAGCGLKFGYRHFAGPVVPAAIESADFVVGDDRSITFVKDRLEVTILPMSADALNRQFATDSVSPDGFTLPNPYATATNPYTYGDWTPPGEDQAPTRFTVFLLKVKNYAYPKVRLDPATIELVSPNGRRYQALSMLALSEYYWPYAVAYGGNARKGFKARRDLLQRTLFPDDMIFSGQEKEGYIVFPQLDRDVENFTLRVLEMALRFDFRNEPVETVDIPYEFQREVYYARERREDKS